VASLQGRQTDVHCPCDGRHRKWYSSWDVTCSKVLSLILQAALGSRAGDVARSTRYSDADCLNWKHVLIKLVSRKDGTQNWEAFITLAYTKGHKDDGSKNHKAQLGALAEPDNFIACPVKWPLILALRTGAVSQTSIEDLQRATEKTVNKLLVW
jgi:hypothetical protein